MKEQGTLLLRLGWDDSPLQGFPEHYFVAGTHLYIWVERGVIRVIKSFLSKETQQPRPHLKPPTTTPPRLHNDILASF